MKLGIFFFLAEYLEKGEISGYIL